MQHTSTSPKQHCQEPSWTPVHLQQPLVDFCEVITNNRTIKESNDYLSLLPGAPVALNSSVLAQILHLWHGELKQTPPNQETDRRNKNNTDQRNELCKRPWQGHQETVSIHAIIPSMRSRFLSNGQTQLQKARQAFPSTKHATHGHGHINSTRTHSIMHQKTAQKHDNNQNQKLYLKE